MDIYHFIVLGILVGYLIGSIPFGLIIGKGMYKQDVRKVGSNNLGATNVARTLGPVAGILVLVLDTLKGGLPGLILFKIAEAYFTKTDPTVVAYTPIIYFATGLAACKGHAHPIFADFKGGKAVTTMLGFIMFHNVKLALFPFIAFVIVMILFKRVSVGSLTAALGCMIFVFVPWCQGSYLFANVIPYTRLTLFCYILSVNLMGIFLFYKHIPNIKRLLKGEEKKFSFGHKGKEATEETK